MGLKFQALHFSPLSSSASDPAGSSLMPAGHYPVCLSAWAEEAELTTRERVRRGDWRGCFTPQYSCGAQVPPPDPGKSRQPTSPVPPSKASSFSSPLAFFPTWLPGKRVWLSQAAILRCVCLRVIPLEPAPKKSGLETCGAGQAGLNRAPAPHCPQCSSGGQIKLWASQTLRGFGVRKQ